MKTLNCCQISNIELQDIKIRIFVVHSFINENRSLIREPEWIFNYDQQIKINHLIDQLL